MSRGSRFACVLVSLALAGLAAPPAGAELPLPRGSVWAWGRNSDGQLGDGTTIERHVPVPVTIPSYPPSISALAGGRRHSTAMAKLATLGWGSGLGPQPAVVENMASKSIAAGAFHTLAVHTFGSVSGWGANDQGQLGDGTTTPSPTPVSVTRSTGLPDVAAAGAGSEHSLAVGTDGSVWAWGDNAWGQLGVAGPADRITPGLVPGLPPAIAVAGGSEHSLALAADGTVWAWGSNGSGELGDGSTVSRHTPARVEGLGNVTRIASYFLHNLALDADGNVWAWGEGSFGQIGDGASIGRLRPVRVPDFGDATAIATGVGFSAAAKTDGTLWTWGYNPDGQLGDGTNTSRKRPVRVVGLGWVIHIAAGSFHMLAVVSPDPPAITSPIGGAAVPTDVVRLMGRAPGSSKVTLFEAGAEVGSARADSSGNWTVDAPLVEGPHTLVGSAEDVSTYVTASGEPVSFVVDVTPPETTITSPPVDTASRDVELSFEIADANASSPRFLCSFDGGSFTPCTSPWRYRSLADGRHIVSVKGVDDAGNEDPTPAEASFIVDTSPPTLTIIDPRPGVYVLDSRTAAPAGPFLIGPTTVRARATETLSDIPDKIVFDVDGVNVEDWRVHPEGDGTFSFLFDVEQYPPARLSYSLGARVVNSVGLESTASVTVVAV